MVHTLTLVHIYLETTYLFPNAGNRCTGPLSIFVTLRNDHYKIVYFSLSILLLVPSETIWFYHIHFLLFQQSNSLLMTSSYVSPIRPMAFSFSLVAFFKRITVFTMYTTYATRSIKTVL